MPLVFYTLKRVLSNRFRTKHEGFYALSHTLRVLDSALLRNGTCLSEAKHYFVTACRVSERSRTLLQWRTCPPGLQGQAFFAILDQESFSATVRLNTGWPAEWSFGSE